MELPHFLHSFNMTIILWILIIIGFVNESFAKDLKIYIYKNKITAVESFVNETSITVKCKVNTRDNPCEWTPKVTFTFPKDIQKPFLQLKMSDLDTSVSIVDHTMLVCSLKATLGLDMIMKIIWEQISKYMDLIIKCPLDAGSHTVRSFHQSGLKMLFTFLPKNRQFALSIIVKIRIGKKIVEIFNFSDVIEIVEV
ncbi:unnamed protein product [Chironomus riparius]|uniref:Uncharacterized protein n=1 Tax=Chironomus riparius TaxID=315576 RepID=A0A9N9X1M7_9DIPT|nr:unnamed protein product [Chironomus riparius]